MRGARLVAQAKINLFLRVLGREASGYHSLETLFQRLTLGDEVTVRVDVAGRAIDCRGADTGAAEHNLAWRAAVSYASVSGWPAGFAIEVEKRIPVGGGLGGGSADAGAVLRLLDHLSPAPLGEGALLQLAVALGADVPFLASSAPRALAWGRGERMLALPPLATVPVTLLLPAVGVATADAFRWLAASRGDSGPESRQLSPADLDSWAGVCAIAGNDFEAPVAARVPAVSQLLAFRERFAPPPDEPAGDPSLVYGMTGSGSTWFLLPSTERARAEAARLPPPMRVVHTDTAEHVVEPQPIE